MFTHIKPKQNKTKNISFPFCIDKIISTLQLVIFFHSEELIHVILVNVSAKRLLNFFKAIYGILNQLLCTLIFLLELSTLETRSPIWVTLSGLSWRRRIKLVSTLLFPSRPTREVWDERADSLEVTGPKGDFRLLGFPVRLYFTLGQLKGNGKTAPPPPT